MFHVRRNHRSSRLLTALVLITALASPATASAAQVADTDVSFVGAGWGHGVGLCQIGAAVMADQGHDHEAILAHYYRGATLQNRYR